MSQLKLTHFPQLAIFDLDNTLHDFTAAVLPAMEAVFRAIIDRHDVSHEEVTHTYWELLRDRSLLAFHEGHPSSYYRKKRFEQLLEKSVGISPLTSDDLLERFETQFAAGLAPFPDAAEVLIWLRDRGVRIAVATEGPIDSQSRTLEAIGLMTQIDDFFPSGACGVSKDGGALFSVVLERTGFGRDECFVIGDSWERDIEGAEAIGIQSFWLTPKETLSPLAHVPILQNLRELPDWLMPLL